MDPKRVRRGSHRRSAQHRTLTGGEESTQGLAGRVSEPRQHEQGVQTRGPKVMVLTGFVLGRDEEGIPHTPGLEKSEFQPLFGAGG